LDSGGRSGWSAFEQPHLRFAVVVAGGWCHVVELGDLLLGEHHDVGCDVLLDPGDALGAGDGRDVVTFGEQPGEGDLPRGGADVGRDRLDIVGDTQVALEVLPSEAGVGLAPVVVGEVVDGADRASEEAVA
jgi:hypothetical protein